MKLKANCKINLGLRVTRRRADGYHDIETVMVPVRDLYDEIEIHLAAATSLEVTGLTVDCPTDKNICMKAARALQRYCDAGDVTIRLHKSVPFGAGLGGGSSDAAMVLRGMNEVLSAGLSDEELERIALEIGSDVPFFIRNTPQLCSGRGEIMTPVTPVLSGYWLALVKPSHGVSTAEAYAGIIPDASGPSVADIVSCDIKEWKRALKNDFERTVFASNGTIADLKALMYEQGALYASMSGSGSAVYGIFEHMPEPEFEQAARSRGAVFIHTGRFN